MWEQSLHTQSDLPTLAHSREPAPKKQQALAFEVNIDDRLHGDGEACNLDSLEEFDGRAALLPLQGGSPKQAAGTSDPGRSELLLSTRSESIASHPRGLFFLALTEAWERFSYYGMSALLALYLTKQLLLPGHVEHVAGLGGLRFLLGQRGHDASPQAFASEIFGLYSAFVYLTPIAGGWLADRYFGARKVVMVGACLLCLGHLAMAFDQSFLLALLLLVLGTGLLKGNISAQVGALYPQAASDLRNHAYLLFSIGISAGAMAGPVICGFLAATYGWHAGFAAAAGFMIVGLLTYVFGLPYIPEDTVRRRAVSRKAAPPPAMSRADRAKIWALLGVIGITVFQTTAYNQSANVGLVWISQHVNLHTPLGRVPEPWFPSIDALSGIIAAPLLLAFWARLGRFEPAPLTKIALGAAIAAGASLLLAIGAIQSETGQASWLWPVLAFCAFGVGYMHYWPTCLALISEAAPKRMKATMISFSFVGFFVGNLLVGYVGTYYEPLGPLFFWLLNTSIAAAGSIAALLTRGVLSRILYDTESKPA